MESLVLSLHRLDQRATLALNALSGSGSDPLWQLFSDIQVWIPLYLLCAAILLRRLGWKRALIVLGTALAAFGTCDQLSNLVKDSVARLRPCYSAEMALGGLDLLEDPGGYYGFFSAHAANAFSLALCLVEGLRLDKSRNYLIFNIMITLWASLVSLSRVFVGKHCLGDLLAGAAIGALLGYALSLLARRLFGRNPRPDSSGAGNPSPQAQG